jgi:hypothetical protein
MKPRFLPLLIATLAVSAATSEARPRRHGRHPLKPAEIALGNRDADDGGGPLARSRGLSQAESAAVGSVVAEIANSAAADAASSAPTRRLSPDYYRVYHRPPPTVAKPHVAAKAATTPTSAPTPQAAVVKKPAVAIAKPAPTASVAVKPPVAARQRVAVAPGSRKAAAKTPPPTTTTTNPVKPIRAVFRD